MFMKSLFIQISEFASTYIARFFAIDIHPGHIPFVAISIVSPIRTRTEFILHTFT
jgi:hypothetical protein